MQIHEQEIDYTTRIGETHDGDPVTEIGLKGGLHIVCSRDRRSGKVDYLGVGPHRAVARYLAKKRQPSIKLTTLAKSDWVDPASFQDIVPKYEAITNQFRSGK